MEELDTLLDAWEKLGPRERKVLLVFALRVWAGQRKYGKLSIDKKDWQYEAIEEALDASVYLAALLNDRTDKAMAAMVSDAEKEVNKGWTKDSNGCWVQDPIPVPETFNHRP